MVRPKVLVVAGFDGSGGAGVLRDVAAITKADGVPRVAVSAITAQDEELFETFRPVEPDLLEVQIEVAARRGLDAIKIGMLGNSANVEVMARFLSSAPCHLPVVADPVLVSTTGTVLADDSTREAMKNQLFPMVTVLTPNVPEAEALTGMEVRCVEDMIEAAQRLMGLGVAAVVVKGGHLPGPVVHDVVATENGQIHILENERVFGRVHGSGCIFSSTLAVRLASGCGLIEAVRLASSEVAEEIRISQSCAITG